MLLELLTIRMRNLRLQIVLAGLVAVLSALYLNISSLQMCHHADSLVPALMGTMQWSPYYWGQNRYGALLPLLASPIGDPVANLFFQQFVNELCGIAVFFLFPCWLGFRRAALTTGAISATVFFACLNTRLLTEYLSIAQPYALSLFLLLAGLLAVESQPGRGCPRWLRVCLLSVGALCLLACFWVNLALFPLAAALHGLRIVCPPPLRKRDVWAGAIALMAMAVNLLAAQAYPIRSSGSFGLQFAHMGSHLQKVVHGVGDGLTALSAWMFPAILAGGVLAVVARWRRATGIRLLTASGVLAGGSLGYLGFLSSSAWVALNLHHPRYAIPGLVAASVLPGLWAAGGVRILARSRWQRNLAAGMAVVLLFAVMTFVFPPVSAAQRNAHWDRQFGRYTDAITASGVAVVYGDFRDVWPAVFHVNAQYQAQGRKNLLYGLTDRSEDTRAHWSALLSAGASAGRLTDSRWPAESMNEDYRRQEAMAAPLTFTETGRLDSVVLGLFKDPASAQP